MMTEGHTDADKERRERSFYPDYIVEILIAAFIVVEIALVLAMLYPQAVGRQIDFSAQFQPKPEWYFLWLYQLVRYFPGKTAFIGAVVIPLSAICLLALIPYLDRGKRGRLRATIAAAALLLAFIVLTLIPALD